MRRVKGQGNIHTSSSEPTGEPIASSGGLVREPQLFLSLCPVILVERVAILKNLRQKDVWMMKQQDGCGCIE